MDGSQTIAWVERRVGALTEAKIEARQATMRNTVEEARERLNAPDETTPEYLSWLNRL